MPEMAGSRPSQGEQAVNPSMTGKQAENVMAELYARGPCGQANLVHTLEYLLRETVHDEDPINDKSFSHMVRFIHMNGRHLLPNPSLGVTRDGPMHLFWRVNNGGFMMNFYPDGKIQFEAIMLGVGQINMTDMITAEEALKHLRLLEERHWPGYDKIDNVGETPV